MREFEIPGVRLLRPRRFADDRGWFTETWSRRLLELDFCQDNMSMSVNVGTVRGLHFQKPPYAQTKLVRAIEGEILDVVVDLRKDQPTFGKYFSVLLSAENKKQILVPKGFAHGFSVLSPTAQVMYKCDALYNKESEAGIVYNDPALKIDWQVDPANIVVSDKDRILPTFANTESGF